MNKKRIISVLLALTIIITSMSLTACQKATTNNDPIQLWYYDYSNIGLYSDYIRVISTKLQLYCKENQIPLEIMCYKEEEMSYEDYCLKRNIAMSQGNTIILDDSRSISNLKGQEADYTKIENYKNVFECYKDRFCVPLAIGYQVYFGNADMFRQKGIDIDRKVITYNKLAELNQQLKEAGVKLKLSIDEFSLTLDYYIEKNQVYNLACQEDKENKDNKDNKALKTAIRATIDEINADLEKYYTLAKSDSIWDYAKDNGRNIIDDELKLYCNFKDNDSLPDVDIYLLQKTNIENTFAVESSTVYYSPYMFIYKKVTNNKVYELANELLSDDYLIAGMKSSGSCYAPVVDTPKVREYCKVNENWESRGLLYNVAQGSNSELDKQVLAMTDEVYQILRHDNEKSNEQLFMDNDKMYTVYYFIYNMVNNKYIGQVTDYDKEIDEFINNLVLHQN